MNVKVEAEDRVLPLLGERDGVRADHSDAPPSPPVGERAGVRWSSISLFGGERWFFSRTRFIQFTKFCLVGSSGVFVDMSILYLLADPSRLGLNITISKFIAAETAMINNFIWNDLWTFRSPSTINNRPSTKLRRFLLFNAICGIGIGLAVLLLHLFHTWLGWNLYLSNLLAIILVTSWNYGINARWNWRISK